MVKHITNVREWENKWHAKGHRWKEYIINDEATPGKNVTLYKTHNATLPVRLLTTGCNTPIENMSRFLESVYQ